MQTKTCTKCGVSKLFSEFTTAKSNKDGLKTACRACCAEYDAQRREKNGTGINKDRREHYAANRYQILARNTAARGLNAQTWNATRREKYATDEVVRNSISEAGKTYRLENADAVRARDKARRLKNLEERRAYSKRYAALNPEKISARAAAYYSKNKEVFAAKSGQYYEANKATSNARSRAYQIENADALREAKRLRRLENAEAVRETRRQHYRDNKHAYLANARKREMQKSQACPRWADIDSIAKVYELREAMTKDTGIQHHVDHLVPITHPLVCGLHVHWNLQVLTAAENLQKSNFFQIT